MSTKPKGPYTPTLIIHGGAGDVTRSNLPPALYAQYHASLLEYLTSTHELLVQQGADAVTAACHAVALLEDDPLFNCGRGSVFNSDGSIEMEASLMVTSIHDEFRNSDSSDSVIDGAGVQSSAQLAGHTKKNAAVSMIKHTRHPILLAKEVLTMADSEGESSKTPGTGDMHGHLSGSWVEEWGFKVRGLERKSRQWFWTKKRWEEHRRGLGLDSSDRAWSQKLGKGPDGMREEMDGDREDLEISPDCWDGTISETDKFVKVPSQGTVGAVCMDSWGNLCVATSTGGLTNKKPGRIGDTPTVGAGFWAESWEDDVRETTLANPIKLVPSGVLAGVLQTVKTATQFWIGDCAPLMLTNSISTTPPMLRIAPATADNVPRKCHQRMDRVRIKMEHQALSFRSNDAADVSALGENNETGIGIEQPMKVRKTIRRAVAMSGTGNGDSFLRMNAVRTAAAISRFSGLAASSPLAAPSKSPVPLQYGVTRMAGPGGELQRSAGQRWGKEGEGEGGIIGVELWVHEEEEDGDDDPRGSYTYADDLRTVKQELLHRREAIKLAGIQKDNLHASSNVVFDFNCGGMWRAYFDRLEDGELTPKIMVFKEEYC